MELPPDGVSGSFELIAESNDGPTHIELWFRPGPPTPRPEPGPVPDWLRPHVEAVLADMQQPTAIPLGLGYYEDEELEHFGTIMFGEDDWRGSWFGFGIETDAPEADLLIALANGLQDNFPQLRGAWGQARPPCPGHTHPARPDEHEGEAWWTCPSNGRLLGRIGSLGCSDGDMA